MKRILIIPAALLMSFSHSFAITLEEALKLAVENNISLKREKITLEAAHRASSHSWNNILPSFSINANEESELPDFKGSASGKNSEINNNLGVEGKITLSLSGDFFSSITKAKLDYEAARISFEEAVTEISSQVKEFYFSLIYAKQKLDYLKENLENAGNQARQNEEKYRKGTLSELEYLSSKVSYEKLKPELKSQELAFLKDLKSFCIFIGLDDDKIELTGLQLNGSLEEYILQYASYFDSSTKNAIAVNVKNGEIPSIIYLKKRLEAAQSAVCAARHSAYGPVTNLSYSVNPVIKGNDEGRIKQTASIGISIPLDSFIPGSKGSDSIKAAQDSVRDLQLQVEQKTQNLDSDFTHIVKSLSQKEESISMLKDFVKLAQANYKTAKYAYSKGMTEFLSMQNASKENLEAKLTLQNEYLENLKLYIALEKLCGKSAFSSTVTEE